MLIVRQLLYKAFKGITTMTQTNTILIVDDQELVRDGLEMLLSTEGYELVFACNGVDALTKVAQITPDVVLLDVMMPEMDGFEVCQRLREIPSLAEVPIIMLTALDDRDSRLRGIKIGADDFISKPYDSLELKIRLRTITNLNRYRKLTMEKNKFQWIIEHTKEAYLVLNQNTQIVYANSQARSYLYLTKDEPINETFLALLTKHYHYPKTDEPEHRLVPHRVVSPETMAAQVFWLQIDLEEISQGADKKYLVHLQDVTNTINTGRQKWTFDLQINHKLRTPLIPITAAIQLAKNRLSPETEAKTREILDLASQGANRLQSEILEILQYLAECNTAQAKSEPCYIADILSIIRAVKKNLEIESVHVFHQSIENPKKISVFISHEAMELVLIELFSNAKKFHPDNLPTLEVNIAVISENIRLEICDDGIWLSSEQLAKLWTPQGKKAGLGLSMVALFIGEVGGTVSAYNRKDRKGIVIELTLPLK